MIETFDRMIARQNAFRDKRGEESIFDIQYAEQLRDPVGQMRKLYAHFDEKLTPECRSGNGQITDQNPQGKHGKHSYTLAEFGLSAAGVHAHFKDYCERYQIPLRDAA